MKCKEIKTEDDYPKILFTCQSMDDIKCGDIAECVIVEGGNIKFRKYKNES